MSAIGMYRDADGLTITRMGTIETRPITGYVRCRFCLVNMPQPHFTGGCQTRRHARTCDLRAVARDRAMWERLVPEPRMIRLPWGHRACLCPCGQRVTFARDLRVWSPEGLDRPAIIAWDCACGQPQRVEIYHQKGWRRPLLTARAETEHEATTRRRWRNSHALGAVQPCDGSCGMPDCNLEY